jgi:hypothetical protein
MHAEKRLGIAIMVLGLIRETVSGGSRGCWAAIEYLAFDNNFGIIAMPEGQFAFEGIRARA